MSDTKHTPEPWEVSPKFSDGRTVANRLHWPICNCQLFVDNNETQANARRIVACVNACAGMADPEKEIATLRAAAEKAREALRLAVEARANYELPGMRFANSSREALAALEEVLK